MRNAAFSVSACQNRTLDRMMVSAMLILRYLTDSFPSKENNRQEGVYDD